MGNPLVTGSPDIKFYAGQPLYSNDGYPLGALCVIDKKPNAITEDQKEILRILAKHVQNKLNSSILIAKLEESVGMLNRIMNQVFPASILEKLKEIEASKANLHQCNLIQVVADDYVNFIRYFFKFDY